MKDFNKLLYTVFKIVTVFIILQNTKTLISFIMFSNWFNNVCFIAHQYSEHFLSFTYFNEKLCTLMQTSNVLLMLLILNF